MTQLASQGPIPASSATRSQVRVSKIENRGLLRIAARGDQPRVLERLTSVFGVSPPTSPPQCADFSHGKIIWGGPGSWIVSTPATETPAISAQLRQALDGTTHLVSEASDAFCIFSISGLGARALLAQVCALDLHASKFRPGDAVSTRFVQIPVIVHMTDDEPSFWLYIDRSFEAYALSWLKDAQISLENRVVLS